MVERLLITAGAGVGVDSGLPDFRGTEGFWRAYPALRHYGFSFEDIANPAGFASNPRLNWGFYGHCLALYRATVPHAGFGILLRWASAMKHGAFVFTSNVKHFAGVPEKLRFLWANGDGGRTLLDSSTGGHQFSKLYGGC
jgi:NAD-dependent SIR2 family protein deacetylase